MTEKLLYCPICRKKKENMCYFSIDFKRCKVCNNCADHILLQQLMYNLEQKWKTYREIMKNDKEANK